MTYDPDTALGYEGTLAGTTGGLPPEVESLLSGGGWRLTPATTAVKLSEGWWKATKHLLYISTIIATAISRGDARIIVSMPPRHGKSELLSVWTPIWYLDHNPDDHVILTSYGADLATGFGRRVRDTIRARDDILNVRIRQDSRRVDSFLTTGRGGMFSVGIGGPVTGRGANLLLVDDYLKNAKDSTSESIRSDIFEWFISTAFTRLEPGGSVIILATRWNIDDLIGRLKKRPETGKWLVIELPALAEKNDPLGRLPGESLWPERYSLESLQAIKNTLGTYFWQSLYQQRPIPGGTNVASEGWFPVIDILPHRSRLHKLRYWDLASTADGGDYTSGTEMSEDIETGIFYVEDIRRAQKSPAAVEMLVQNTAEHDGRDVKVIIEQEPGASGKSLVDHFVRNVLKEFTVDGRRASGDKFVRAQPFLAAAEAGKVRLLRGSWNQGFIDEILVFPEGENDDQVDSTCGAFNELIAKRPKAGTWGREPAKDARPAGGQLVTGAVWGRNRR